MRLSGLNRVGTNLIDIDEKKGQKPAGQKSRVNLIWQARKCYTVVLTNPISSLRPMADILYQKYQEFVEIVIKKQ